MNFGSRNLRSSILLLVIHVLAVLAATCAFGQTVFRTQVYHQLTTFTKDGVRAWGRDLPLSADGSQIAFTRQFYGTPGSNFVCTIEFDDSDLTLVDQCASDPTVEVGISSMNEPKRFYRSVQLP